MLEQLHNVGENITVGIFGDSYYYAVSSARKVKVLVKTLTR